MKTRRAFLLQPGQFEIREVDIEPLPGQVLIRVEVCGLCHWELNHWHGVVGTFPQTVGHEFTGEIVQLGSAVTGFEVGERVTAVPISGETAGFSEYLCVTADYCVRIPKSIPTESAVFEPLMCQVNVLRQARPEVGDHAVLMGVGAMGLNVLQMLGGSALASLTAIDLNDERLAVAKRFGASHTINPKTQDAMAELEKITQGHLADFVIEGTGVPAVLNDCLRYLRPAGGGRLLMMSSHEGVTKELDLREGVRKSAQIIVAHGGLSANQMDDMRRAVQLVEAGKVDIGPLVTHRYTLDAVAEGFKALEHPPAGYIKGIVLP